MCHTPWSPLSPIHSSVWVGGPLSEHMCLCSIPVICSLFSDGDS